MLKNAGKPKGNARGRERSKTFEQRFEEEMSLFEATYREIEKSIVSEGHPWISAFDIIFEDGEVELQKQPDEPAWKNGESIRNVIRHYHLHESRTRTAKFESRSEYFLHQMGLTKHDLTSQCLKVDRSDPLFWRTLLEIFCKCLVTGPGRSKYWTRKRIIELALDAEEVCLSIGKDTASAIALYMSKNEPYKSRFAEHNKKNGNGIRSALGRVKGIAGSFGQGFFERLVKAEPHLVVEVIEERILASRVFEPRPTNDAMDAKRDRVMAILSQPVPK